MAPDQAKQGEPPWQRMFRSDCLWWRGYRPCERQTALGLPHCRDCNGFEPSPVVDPVAAFVDYSPACVASANCVGIVEAGGLGSVLRTTTVSRAVRTINSSARILWFTHSRGVDLLRFAPSVEAISIESDPEYCSGVARDVDVLLNFEMSEEVVSIVRSARVVGGFRVNAQGKFEGVMPFAEDLVRLQIDDDFRASNRRTLQRIMLDSLGFTTVEAGYDVMLDERSHAMADECLTRFFPGIDAVVGLNVGTSEKGALRRWPVESYAELAVAIAKRFPSIGVLVLRGPDDNERVDRVKRLIAPISNVAVMDHVLDVGAFLALVGRLATVVTSDTFAVHAARSQQTPVVAMVGPMPPQELEIGGADRVLEAGLGCSPCYHACRRSIRGQCMSDIAAGWVLAAVSGVLGFPLGESSTVKGLG